MIAKQHLCNTFSTYNSFFIFPSHNDPFLSQFYNYYFFFSGKAAFLFRFHKSSHVYYMNFQYLFIFRISVDYKCILMTSIIPSIVLIKLDLWLMAPRSAAVYLLATQQNDVISLAIKFISC